MRLVVCFLILFASAGFSEETKKPKPLSQEDKDKAPQLMLQLQQVQISIMKYRNDHPELAAMEQEMTRVTNEWVTNLAKWQKEYGAEGCDLQFNLQWKCLPPPNATPPPPGPSAKK